MLEITLNNQNYRVGKLDAMKQGQLARRLAPLVTHAIPAIRTFAELFKEAKANGEASEIPLDKILDSLGSVAPLADALCDLKDETFEQIVRLSMSTVTRQQGNAWSAVQRGDVMMFADMDFEVVLPLVTQAIRANLGNFIAGLVSQGLAAQNPAPQVAG